VVSGTGRFRRSDRLRDSRDYKRVSLHNTRQASREFVVLLASAGPAATGSVRLGITASRKVGNAVARNRVKRAVRDWFRTRKPTLPSARSDGLDVVVIARRGATRLAAPQIAERLEVLVGRAVKEWA